jgi:hypothetical protein
LSAFAKANTTATVRVTVVDANGEPTHYSANGNDDALPQQKKRKLLSEATIANPGALQLGEEAAAPLPSLEMSTADNFAAPLKRVVNRTAKKQKGDPTHSTPAGSLEVTKLDMQESNVTLKDVVGVGNNKKAKKKSQGLAALFPPTEPFIHPSENLDAVTTGPTARLTTDIDDTMPPPRKKRKNLPAVLPAEDREDLAAEVAEADMSISAALTVRYIMPSFTLYDHSFSVVTQTQE